ncbi:MAG TPA: hypothetical protein VFD48_05635 [Pyrinomonadaceae bacterium]|nr:hypothetical protein [Pyrinomonadaceae bacterium]
MPVARLDNRNDEGGDLLNDGIKTKRPNSRAPIAAAVEKHKRINDHFASSVASSIAYEVDRFWHRHHRRAAQKQTRRTAIA